MLRNFSQRLTVAGTSSLHLYIFDISSVSHAPILEVTVSGPIVSAVTQVTLSQPWNLNMDPGINLEAQPFFPETKCEESSTLGMSLVLGTKTGAGH